MLTTEQIRVLNDARTILKQIDVPRSYEGGRCAATCQQAEQSIMQALVVLQAWLEMPLTDDQLHNTKPPAVFACVPDESCGYDRSDPKHPDWHSTHADLWDSRDR